MTPFLQGKPSPPNSNEAGWKDTFKMLPGQVTRVLVRFAPTDRPAGLTIAGTNYYTFDPTEGPGYVWHCHIIDHEDNEMMRPYRVVAGGQASIAKTTDASGQAVVIAEKPVSFGLEQNYPNPFNPTTTIRFALPYRSYVTLVAFNIIGQRVAELVNGEIDAGYHEVKFDAAGLASGVYVYRLQAGGVVQTRKLLLLR